MLQGAAAGQALSDMDELCSALLEKAARARAGQTLADDAGPSGSHAQGEVSQSVLVHVCVCIDTSCSR